MYPHYQQPRQQTYYQPLQSRGFQPPSQQQQQPRPPQQPPYQSAVPPAVPGYIQQYQGYPQYQQQRSGQYYQQPQSFSHPQQQQQQQYVPQPQAARPPALVAPHVHNQGFFPPAPQQTHTSYVPFTSYPRPPVSAPARSRSWSPEKSARLLPASAAGSRQSPTTTLQAAFVAPVQPQGPPYPSQPPHSHVNPPTSSFSRLPTSQTFPGGQPLAIQTHTYIEPQQQPQVHHHTPPAHTQVSLPRSQTSTPSTSPAPTPDSPTKRPLPAPPGGAAPSPPATLGSSNAAGSPAQRRALPYSPTKPPSVQAARTAGIRLPQRSSTLPTPLKPHEGITNDAASSGSKDDTGQTRIQLTSFVKDPPLRSTEEPQPARNTGFAPPPNVQSKPSDGFALPPPKKPTQSLAFRIASLSLQEEESQKRVGHHPIPRAPANKSAIDSRSRSPTRSTIDLHDAPPTSSIRQASFDLKSASGTSYRQQGPSSVPIINDPGRQEDGSIDSGVPVTASVAPSISVSMVPSINVIEASSIAGSTPSINVSEVPAINVSEPPSINISEAHSSEEGPVITVSEATPKITVSELPPASTPSFIPDIIVADLEGTLDTSANGPAQKRKGLICYGCGRGILGRIVSAMGGRWHPACFKCTVCSELLEHVSSYEHGGKPYCHLDYHEKFAPQCYHCRTPIIDERFITLDDPALGKRTYHEQHFFCAECGDPFLAPTIPGMRKGSGTPRGVAQDDDVGFTVYKGHPYCEACHVRLRYPKCKRCKKSIRDGMKAVEALGGKWCWECFLCAGCEKPFKDPSFFQRDNKAYCETCFSVIIKNEL